MAAELELEVLDLEWDATERRLWSIDETTSTTDWCAQNIWLRGATRSQGQQFSPDLTPYLREILDCFNDPEVIDITLCMSTQTGKTTTSLLFIANAIDRTPGDILIGLPDEKSSQELLNERVKPMIELSPCLRRHVTGRKTDWLRERVTLDTVTIYLGWSTSPMSLAGRPVPFVLLDEVAKFSLFSKDEGNPVSLATERNRTFVGQKKRFKTSTPKRKNDPHSLEWQASDRRHYWVPCPHCDEYQTLEFSKQTLRWPEGERDHARIVRRQLATYHCKHCSKAIPDSIKLAMLRRGVWCPEGCTVARDGSIEGEQPEDLYRGYHLNCFYSPWLTWSDIAAEFLKSKDEVSKLMNFHNSWLALPWEETSTTSSDDQIDAHRTDYESGTVPAGVQVLIASADLQRDGAWYVVRGWGARDESWLIASGKIEPDPVEGDLAKLARFMNETAWPAASGDQQFRVRLCTIDSGDGKRTWEVYDACVQNPAIFRAVKGVDKLNGAPVQTSYLEKADGRRRFPGATMVSRVDTDYFKTKIMAQIRSGERWHIPRDVSADYVEQMTSEHKVVDRDRNGRVSMSWQTKPGKPRNHLLDAECYAEAGAYLLLLNRLGEAPPPRPKSEPDDRERDDSGRRPSRRRKWVGGRW